MKRPSADRAEQPALSFAGGAKEEGERISWRGYDLELNRELNGYEFSGADVYVGVFTEGDGFAALVELDALEEEANGPDRQAALDGALRKIYERVVALPKMFTERFGAL